MRAADNRIIWGADDPSVQSQKSPNSEETGVPRELEKNQSEVSRAYDSLNTLNPLSARFGQGNPAFSGYHEPGLQKSVSELQHLLTLPGVQRYLKLISNPAFSRGFDQILKSPQRLPLLYAEIAWLLAMLIFRSWRLSLHTHWFRRFWVRTGCFLIFSVGSVLILPWAILGNSYPQTLLATYQTLTSQL